MSIGKLFNTSKELLDSRAAAAFLDLQPGTLAVWRSTGRHKIPFLKIGRNVRYRLEDLKKWMSDQTRTSGATAWRIALHTQAMEMSAICLSSVTRLWPPSARTLEANTAVTG